MNDHPRRTRLSKADRAFIERLRAERQAKRSHPGWRVGFTKWLRRQVGRQDPVGELGRHAAECPVWQASKYRSVVIRHLQEQHGAGGDEIEAVMQAWREFREFKTGRPARDGGVRGGRRPGRGKAGRRPTY